MRLHCAVIGQGIISQFPDPLCFQAWNVSTNSVTYVLYRQRSQEHITLIEHIPDYRSAAHEPRGRTNNIAMPTIATRSPREGLPASSARRPAGTR